MPLGRYVFGISEEKNVRPRVSAPIVFTDEDLATVEVLHADPLIIKPIIGDVIVSRVLVDGGSSSDVIFWNALRRMGAVDEIIQPINTHIYTFDGTKVYPNGKILCSRHPIHRECYNGSGMDPFNQRGSVNPTPSAEMPIP